MQRVAALVLVALLAAPWSGPMASGALELTNQIFQEIEVKGPEGKAEVRTVPAVKVVPGTDVIYVITYRNAGPQPAADVVISSPIPKEMELIADSASGTGTVVESSVDSGVTFAPLAELSVRESDGTRRPARAADVTNLRWLRALPVSSGEQGSVTFRARLK